MGGFLSSSAYEDKAATLSKSAMYLRSILAVLVVPCMIMIVLCGLVLLIIGVAVGAASHWSGYLVGGVLFIASIAGAIMFWDLWGTVSLGLCMFELASAPKSELVKKLDEYGKRSKLQTVEDGDATDQVLSKLCEKIADQILGKFQMALQWAPLLFTAIAILCVVLSKVIDDVPHGLFIASIMGGVFGMMASFFGISFFCCILSPLVEKQVKNSIDDYVESLQKKLHEDEGGATVKNEPKPEAVGPPCIS